MTEEYLDKIIEYSFLLKRELAEHRLHRQVIFHDFGAKKTTHHLKVMCI